MFHWPEDAWLLASLQYGASQVRSRHLLLTRRPGAPPHSRALPEPSALPVEHASSASWRRSSLRAARPSRPRLSRRETLRRLVAQPNGDAALPRFTTSWTERARKGLIDPILGRHAEIRQVIEILARRRKNNPIIVGEPGVGKTALVEGLARAIALGDVPEALRGVEVPRADMGLLHAGAGVRGEFGEAPGGDREASASPVPIVLFIDEAHTVVGKEADAANLLKPALARGELRTIAATTWSEYKKYFEKDAAFARRFQPVRVEEPSEAQTLVMPAGCARPTSFAHGVTIRDEALIAAAALSHRYIAGR
ncbi:MAG: AAA family ATPase [Polyangiaceae bacterium]|nr:AAA family ATPase [Polyangiaceae bacterium]